MRVHIASRALPNAKHMASSKTVANIPTVAAVSAISFKSANSLKLSYFFNSTTDLWEDF